MKVVVTIPGARLLDAEIECPSCIEIDERGIERYSDWSSDCAQYVIWFREQLFPNLVSDALFLSVLLAIKKAYKIVGYTIEDQDGKSFRLGCSEPPQNIAGDANKHEPQQECFITHNLPPKLADAIFSQLEQAFRDEGY